VNGARPQPPYGVPTLTEVVEPPHLVAPVAEPVAADAAPNLPEPPAELAAAVEPDLPPQAAGLAIDEDQLIERVLADLQRQVELMLEYRLREVLTPALTRATDALVKDARVELASTLRDVVARAVAQEILRHRGR
jgi:hypothetical protein